jgi:hypothetical protein
MEAVSDPRRTNPFDAARNLAALEHLLQRVERVNALPRETLLARAPSISGWSAGEHAFHLILACDLSFRNATALLHDKGRLIREPEDRQDQALAILRRGRIPRGVASAPRFVRPPAKLTLELLHTLTGEVQQARAALADQPRALEEAPRAIPHQLLGDLSGCEWVRFARVHTAHHLLILREVLGG